LEPDNIKIHPDDAAMDIRINEENLLKIKANYAAKVLGSYIGTPEFILKNLAKKMTSLKEEALLLLEHRNIQERYIFLRYLLLLPKDQPSPTNNGSIFDRGLF
jgi:hypothetical protein